MPSRPWTQYNKGGYLLLDSLIMRGGYGPYGPAKAQVRGSAACAMHAAPAGALTDACRIAQVEALRNEEIRAKQAGEPSGFQRVLDALNVLGRTPWCDHPYTSCSCALAHAAPAAGASMRTS